MSTPSAHGTALCLWWPEAALGWCHGAGCGASLWTKPHMRFWAQATSRVWWAGPGELLSHAWPAAQQCLETEGSRGDLVSLAGHACPCLASSVLSIPVT